MATVTILLDSYSFFSHQDKTNKMNTKTTLGTSQFTPEIPDHLRYA
jgi:hypothetical protein